MPPGIFFFELDIIDGKAHVGSKKKYIDRQISTR